MKATEEKQTQREERRKCLCTIEFPLRSHLSAHFRSFGRRFVQSGLVFDGTRRVFGFHLHTVSFSAAIALRVRHFDSVAEITESVSKSQRKCNGRGPNR